MAEAVISEKVSQYIKQQPDWFENLVLAAALKDLEFFNRVENVLCVDITGDEKCYDFTQEKLRNVVYTVAAGYNQAQKHSMRNEFVPINSEVMAILLKNALTNAEDILEHEIPQAMQLFEQAISVDVERWKPFLELGISEWLQQQKIMQVIKSPYMFGGWTIGDIREKLAIVDERSKAVDEHHGGTRRGLIGQYLDAPPVKEPEKDLLPSNLRGLNEILGGGFRKKDTVMIISPTGGGKTVLACQLAGHWCNIGKGGILVTTEQDQAELEERFVSNFANIPFSQVVGGRWDPYSLSEKQLHSYKKWRQQMSAPIQVVDWTTPGKTVVEDLRSEILFYEKQFGELPEYLIFDWIGGALQDLSGGDPKKLRSLYKTAVDNVCYACREFHMVGVVLAQATAGDSINKGTLDIRHIADAKNMLEKPTTLIGLTALFAEGMDEETDSSKALYASKQFLCCSKVRKGQGGTTPVKRRYEYQKLENWEGY